MSSKSPLRMFCIIIGECLLPVSLKALNFAQSFLNLYIYHSWRPNHISPLRNQKYPPRLLGWWYGEWYENLIFQFTKGPPKGLYMSLLIHELYSQLDSIQEPCLLVTVWHPSNNWGKYWSSCVGFRLPSALRTKFNQPVVCWHESLALTICMN